MSLESVAHNSKRVAEGSRGRNAKEPEQIPARGWWDVAMRVKNDLGRDNVSLIAGGLAMYALLSVFPALAAAVSFYGLVFTPTDVIQQMHAFSAVLPPGSGTSSTMNFRTWRAARAVR